MYRKINMNLGRDFFLYSLSFLLLMEWLLPLPQISDTGFIHIFIVTSAVFFIITFFQLPAILSIGIKTIVTFYGMYRMFFEGTFFSYEWVSLFLTEITKNITIMINGEWFALTDMFRSFLFLLLLAIMSYLLFYWTIQVRRVMFFLFFTVVYVAIIDTFTIYDASFAMMRTFFIGFLLLGLVTIYRRIEYENVDSSSKFLPVRLAMLLAMMIVGGGIFGVLSPKPEPQWSDPVPFVRTAIGMGQANDLFLDKKIGYGENDERLGGGFRDDDTPVFYAATTAEHYWRGETKDFYTGKGWETTTPTTEDYDPMGEGIEEHYEADVAFSDEADQLYSHIFYPGELVTRTTINEVSLSVDSYTTKARTHLGDAPITLPSYHLEYALPDYQLDDLRSTSGVDPEVIQRYYTQLPDDLPERINNLALELVENKENRFDRAKAIENYLSSSTFSYETEDVPMPDEGEDYVDQFLFESYRGYCDNFSTSMVVLLRSLNIPARWAKGFTQGDKIESLDDQREVYQITNGNAHSWVEVYFPEVGWVPFEPTKGFEHGLAISEEELLRADLEMNEEKEEEKDEEKEVKKENELTGSGFMFPLNWNQGGIWFLLALFIGMTFFVIIRNKKVVHYYTYNRFKNRHDEKAFIQAYDRLLWLLNYFGCKRKSSETLREYAIRMDGHFQAHEMILLTNEYERIMYGGKLGRSSWSEHKSNWESFMIKIKS